MQTSGMEVLPKAIIKVLAAALILLTAALAQAPSAAATSSSSPGFYDPLPQDIGEAGLKLELRKLQTTGRLMMVVAHPDDLEYGAASAIARWTRGLP